MIESNFPVFTRRGDVVADVEKLADELARGAGRESIGLHKVMYVMRVDMTVVMVTGRETPLAEALRGNEHWKEPRDE